MRLFLKDRGTEITDIHFDNVRKVMTTGGALGCSIRDTTLSNVVANFSNTMERVEVRKNDGSTVIWEGAIDRCTQYSQPTWKFQMIGREILAFMDRIPCNYSSIKRRGVVTATAGDFIIDDNAAFSDLLLTKLCYFSNTSAGESSELIWPHANSTWYNNVGAGADDPADTETKTTAGDETDLAQGGDSRYWEIHDTSAKGKDWYGICIDFEAPNSATSQRVVINIDCKFSYKATYLNEANTPLIEIYDVTGTQWEDDDTLNAGNITGIGRTGHFSESWDQNTYGYKGKIEIIDNCDRYFDGSDFLKIRILCGETTAGEGFDRVRVNSAILTNVYDGDFTSAGETTYTIDGRTATTLTFTGQTPNTDGVNVGSSYTIGDYLHTNMQNIWAYGQITWVDLDFDTATIGEANEYRGMSVGHVLTDFAERLDWQVWQAVGWVIKCYGTYTDTALSLTEDNFTEWSMAMTTDETFGQVILWGSGSYGTVSWTSGTYYTPEGKFYIDTRWAEEAMGMIAGDNYGTRFSTAKRIFSGTMDLDDGTDYSALDIGKTVDILIQTDKLVISDGLITELSYEQNAGEHLMCNIVVMYDP